MRHCDHSGGALAPRSHFSNERTLRYGMSAEHSSWLSLWQKRNELRASANELICIEGELYAGGVVRSKGIGAAFRFSR